MRRPETITKKFFEEYRKGMGFNPPILFISGSNMHPNPRFYKYYFWVYAENSPLASADDVFFKEEHKLTYMQALKLMEKLAADDIGFAYLNRRYYRLGNKVFDYERLKKVYPGIKFAPSYDDDPENSSNKEA